MVAITKEQARDRFTIIPSSLQDAMFSEQTAKIIDQVASENHLTDARADALSGYIGWALLGFIHPEDLGKELQTAAAIPAQTAENISKEINTKIFAALKPDLDRAYAPTQAPLPSDDDDLPIVKDITPAAKSTLPPQASASASAPAPLPTGVVAAPTPKPIMPAAVPKPDFSSPGWSKLPSSVAGPAPMPMSSMPMPKQVQAPTAPIVPLKTPIAAPKPAAQAAPVIIHEDAALKTQAAKPDFHIAIHSEDLEIQKVSKTAPLKPAVLELGKAPMPKPGIAPTARVVHYDEFKEKMLGNIPAPGAKGAAGRQVSEITSTSMPSPAPAPATPGIPKPASNIPVPPAAPKPMNAIPVQMPKPAQAPQAPQTLKPTAPAVPATPKPPTAPIAPTKMAEEIKVIQKDYL